MRLGFDDDDDDDDDNLSPPTAQPNKNYSF